MPDQIPSSQSGKDSADENSSGYFSTGIGFGRRDLIKTTAVLFSTGFTAAGSVSIFGKPVTAESGSGSDFASVNNHPTGDIEDVYLDGSSTFKLTWDNLIRGDIIKLKIDLAPTHVSTPPSKVAAADGSTDDKTTAWKNKFSFLGSREVIGKMGYQVEQGSSPDGGKAISGSEFFSNRERKNLAEHPDINSEFFSVDVDLDKDIKGNPAMDGGVGENEKKDGITDLDVWTSLEDKIGTDPITSENDDYIRITVYELRLLAAYPGKDFEKISEWDLVFVANLNSGFGLNFGRSFGIGSDSV